MKARPNTYRLTRSVTLIPAETGSNERKLFVVITQAAEQGLTLIHRFILPERAPKSNLVVIRLDLVFAVASAQVKTR